MKRWTWMWLVMTVVGCSVPAFSPRRMDARVDTNDIGADSDANDAVSAPEIADVVATDIAPDADADAPDVNASDAPPDVVPGDVSVDVPPRPDATPLLTGSFVSSAVPSTPTGLLSGGFTWQGDLRSERLRGRLR